MKRDEIKIGMKVRVSKARWEVELDKNLDPYSRIGIVQDEPAPDDMTRLKHEGRIYTVRWFIRDLEPHDHREPCACYECAS